MKSYQLFKSKLNGVIIEEGTLGSSFYYALLFTTKTEYYFIYQK